MKWEYLYVCLEGAYFYPDWVRTLPPEKGKPLNGLGADGWEMICAFPFGAAGRFVAYFKRPVELNKARFDEAETKALRT
jgi:hypothetical protein